MGAGVISSVSSGELLLREILLFNIDNENVVYNHRGLGIKNDKTGRDLEIDIYYPDYKLAFEFQGEEHYNVTGFADDELVEEIKRRDLIKEKFCKENDIILFGINALNLSSGLGRIPRRIIPNINLFHRSIRNSSDMAKIKNIEWRCKEYRKYLNKTYVGHTSAKGDARLWREKLKKQGIPIPIALSRKATIPTEVKEVVELGKYEEWCAKISKEIQRVTDSGRYISKGLRHLSLYLP